jgi:hypothetical protein
MPSGDQGRSGDLAPHHAAVAYVNTGSEEGSRLNGKIGPCSDDQK